MTDTARLRGRRGRDRHIAEDVARRAVDRTPGTRTAGSPGDGAQRSRTPDLRALPELLVATGELQALVDRFALVKRGRARPGPAACHVRGDAARREELPRGGARDRLG
jgi:hypothetical protein